MASAFQPEPDPRGQRLPPRRNPPTAVGVATPPPPRRRDSHGDRTAARRRRLAIAFIATVLGGSGLGIVGVITRPLIAAALGGVGLMAGLALWIVRSRQRSGAARRRAR